MMDRVLLNKIRKFGKTPILTLTPQRIVGYSLGIWFGGHCVLCSCRRPLTGVVSLEKWTGKDKCPEIGTAMLCTSRPLDQVFDGLDVFDTFSLIYEFFYPNASEPFKTRSNGREVYSTVHNMVVHNMSPESQK